MDPNQPAKSSTSPNRAHSADEILLTGGRITEGVVQIGKTVRRPSLPSSLFVSQLLLHLEAVGFAGSPRYLGQDEKGRDILTFLEGWVPEKFQKFTNQQIHHAAILLRNFHSATINSELSDQNSVVCHHDAGPNNTVFQDGQPVALIDFDMAAPGEPIEDVAYMAWSWCISSKPDRGPASGQAEQIRILLDSYGINSETRFEFIEAILERQNRNTLFWKNFGQNNLQDANFRKKMRLAKIEEIVNWSKQEMKYTQANRHIFEKAIIQQDCSERVFVVLKQYITADFRLILP